MKATAGVRGYLPEVKCVVTVTVNAAAPPPPPPLPPPPPRDQEVDAREVELRADGVALLPDAVEHRRGGHAAPVGIERGPVDGHVQGAHRLFVHRGDDDDGGGV